MFQLKEAIFLPSFPLFITVLSPVICANVVNFAWRRTGNAHTVWLVGEQLPADEWWKKLLEVVTFPTNLVQKRKCAHKVNLNYLLILHFLCFLSFVSYSHLYSYILVCFTSSSRVQRPGKEFSVSFSQTFNFFNALSLYWTFYPRIQKHFASGI